MREHFVHIIFERYDLKDLKDCAVAVRLFGSVVKSKPPPK